jgi:mono/diheme cytochrome c family protein
MRRSIRAMVFLLGFAASALAVGCGSYESDYSEPPPPPPGKPEPEDATFKAECGSCHGPGGQSPRIETAAQARVTNAKARIQAGTMPPNKRLSAETKATLVGAL